jgi:hypothetical protein
MSGCANSELGPQYVDGIEETVNAGSSSLSYAAGSGAYNDGTTARANFTFH